MKLFRKTWLVLTFAAGVVVLGSAGWCGEVDCDVGAFYTFHRVSLLFWELPIAFYVLAARREMWCVFKCAARQACRVCTVAGDYPRVPEVAHPFVVGYAGCHEICSFSVYSRKERLLCHLCHNRSGSGRSILFGQLMGVLGMYLYWEHPSVVPGEGLWRSPPTMCLCRVPRLRRTGPYGRTQCM